MNQLILASGMSGILKWLQGPKSQETSGNTVAGSDSSDASVNAEEQKESAVETPDYLCIVVTSQRKCSIFHYFVTKVFRSSSNSCNSNSRGTGDRRGTISVVFFAPSI